MAILQSTGIRGFLVSAKRTGNKILNSLGKSVDEYVENFLTGFSGYGWKIWEYTNGKYKLELDALTVRGTFSVYELLVQKIRAVKGALGITQANGKIKAVSLSEDGTEYLITVEDEMSFSTNDFIRCQNFTGTNVKLYHVRILEITDSNTVIHLDIDEFQKDSNGTVINPPEIGDEIVQFGNSTDTTRQSAIYLHADEGGQPAIDVMFGINSTDWSSNVKIRIGGEIPGSGGLKGFYCVNGMVKGVNDSGHTTYCIYPDGSAMFGDGSAQFNADKSGYLAGGAISWEWNTDLNKFVTTMGDVVLQWGNLSPETQANLKGDKGDTGNPGTPGEDGADGANGENGSIVVRFEWAIGVQCMANSIIPGQTSDTNKYLSVAMVRDNSLSSGWRAYRCLQAHITAVGNAPGNTDYWTEFDVNLSSVFTSLIVAKNASIEFLSGNELRILNGSGNVAAGVSGSGTGSTGIRFFAGGSNPQIAPWRVNELGAMFSTSGKIGGLSIDGNGLTNDFTEDAYVIFRKDSENTFVGIGTNVLPSSSGVKALARFENEQSNCSGDNFGVIASAKNGSKNHAIFINSGFISGFAINQKQINSSMTLTNDLCHLSCYNSSEITLTLPSPSTAEKGKMYIIRRMNSANVKLVGTIHDAGAVSETNVGSGLGDSAMLVNDGQYWCYNTMFRH